MYWLLIQPTYSPLTFGISVEKTQIVTVNVKSWYGIRQRNKCFLPFAQYCYLMGWGFILLLHVWQHEDNKCLLSLFVYLITYLDLLKLKDNISFSFMEENLHPQLQNLCLMLPGNNFKQSVLHLSVVSSYKGAMC